MLKIRVAILSCGFQYNLNSISEWVACTFKSIIIEPLLPPVTTGFTLETIYIIDVTFGKVR